MVLYCILEPECWELMFRGTADSGDSAANAYIDGMTGVTTTDPDCMLVQNNSCTQHYRNPKLDSWETLGVRKVNHLKPQYLLVCFVTAFNSYSSFAMLL